MASTNEPPTSTIVGEAHRVLFDGIPVTDTNGLLKAISDSMVKVEARLSHIESHVTKIQEIQVTLAALTTKIDSNEHEIKLIHVKNPELSDKIKKMETVSRDTETSAQALSDLYDSVSTAVDRNSKEVKECSKNIQNIQSARMTAPTADMTSFRKDHDQLQRAITDLQCRSMKCNLIFTGLSESYNENTEGLLRDFIYSELGIDEFMQFGNVHRFGRRRGRRPRAIVARFVYNNQLMLLKNAAFKLRGKRYGINEQYPASIEDTRKVLYPVMKEKKRNGHKVAMVRDNLYIDGELYVHDHESEESITAGTTEDLIAEEDSRSYSGVLQTSNQPRYQGGKKPAAKRPRAPSTPPRDEHGTIPKTVDEA